MEKFYLLNRLCLRLGPQWSHEVLLRSRTQAPMRRQPLPVRALTVDKERASEMISRQTRVRVYTPRQTSPENVRTERAGNGVCNPGGTVAG